MKLYVFNPDADMALGNNEENYMAPATIRRMAEDLALLPIWYAQPGSGVLASSAYNADYLKQMQQLFRLDVHLVTEPELPDYADVRVMPWGWNPAIRKRMLKGGVLEKNLPTPDALDKYRMKAARSNALAFRALFYFNKIDYTCGDGCCLVEADGRISVAKCFGRLLPVDEPCHQDGYSKALKISCRQGTTGGRQNCSLWESIPAPP